MKIAFISDMHGSAWATASALKAAKEWGAQRIAVLGDVMYHGPRNPFPREYDPMEVASLLNEQAGEITAVRGNCDSEVDQMQIEYPMMGDYAVIALPERDIFLTHGHVYNPGNHPHLRPGTVLAFGHIHTPVAEKHGDIYFFNPGSASLPKEPYPHSWGRYSDNMLEIVDFDGNIVKRLEL